MQVKTNTGYQSTATNTGDYSTAMNTGFQSTARARGKESIALAMGIKSKAAASLESWIVLAEWKTGDDGYCHIVDVKAAKVDGETLKPDTYYKLVNGEFVEG
jgi:hypothetical protein